MFNLVSLIETFGYLGLFIIVYAESGLLFGFFLPGDSLLFTAGFLASQNFLNIYYLVPMLFIAAVLGDNTGYFFGRKVGPRIFKREDSFLFHKDNLERSRLFFEAHGGKSLILARFLPIIRTFTPILAGVGRMPYRVFFFYSILGAAVWTSSLTILGYYMGRSIPHAEKYILPIVLLIIIVSFMPSVISILKDPESRQKIASFLKSKN